jgi:arabinogalactan endo-1,4-beta-galactosidase
MGSKVKKVTKRVSQKKGSRKSSGMIDFHYGDVSYQIDPTRRKVYRQWVEVETAKTFLIMGAYNHLTAQTKKAV